MSVLPNTLNGLNAIAVRLSIPWRGAYLAEVELDVDSTLPVDALIKASAPAILVVGDKTLTGIIDSRGSGTFGGKATVRVVGGRGGWDSDVKAQHFYGPGGSVNGQQVEALTGALVLESVADPLGAKPFGDHYVRTAGPASEVFGDKDWFVDPITGITTVAPWPPGILDSDAVLNDFIPAEKKLTVYSDTPIFPGTVFTANALSDDRLGTQILIARDVEQYWDHEGSRAEVWCADGATSRLADAFKNAVRSFGQTSHLKTYKYRYVLPEGSAKASLQAITDGAPDLNPMDQWVGVSGFLETLAPGTEVVIGFAGADPAQPYLITYSPLAIPLTSNLTAATSITLAAPAINLAGAVLATSATFGAPGTAVPLAFGPWASALQAGLSTFAAALVSATTIPQVNAAGTLLAGLLGTLPPSQTVFMKGN